MKIIDARSGKELKVGETIFYPDNEYLQLLEVIPGFLIAQARIKRRYLGLIRGEFDLIEDEVWTPLAVRYTHPKYFLQHVAFIPS